MLLGADATHLMSPYQHLVGSSFGPGFRIGAAAYSAVTL